MENANTFWADKPIYADAECKYYEQLAKEVPLTPLADKVAKARQRLIEIKDTYNKDPNATASEEAVKCLEAKVSDLLNIVSSLQSTIGLLENRVCQLENKCTIAPVNLKTIESTKKPVVDDDDDDDVDLFGSESEDDEKAAKVKEERVAAYNAKKSKKPALIAKSNVILDIKPWDDETDMKAMELEIRKIVADGLLLGAAKLVPLAYGIFKLQMSCVIEDEKISVDWLQENIESIEDYVQSCDVAAFNKI